MRDFKKILKTFLFATIITLIVGLLLGAVIWIVINESSRGALCLFGVMLVCIYVCYTL